jgi:hypothetical protein
MPARVLSAVEPVKGWQPWGALVPFLGIAFVASTVISLTAVLQYAGLVDNKENPIGLWDRLSPGACKTKVALLPERC